MTITEANAANEVAREIVALVARVEVSPALEHGVGVLLLNAHKTLQAGFTVETFLQALSTERQARVARVVRKGQ